MNPKDPIRDRSASLTVRPSVTGDVAYLAPRLRKEDLRSVLASGSPSAEDALNSVLIHSDLCLTADDQSGKPFLMFGTVPNPQDDTLGHVWFMASDSLDTCKTSLLREAHRYVTVFLRKYTILSSFIDCRAPVRRRWLRGCGFEFVGTIIGPGPGEHTFQEAIRFRGN